MAAALLMELLRQGFTCRYDDCHAWSVRRTRGGNFFFFFFYSWLCVSSLMQGYRWLVVMIIDQVTKGGSDVLKL